MYLVTAEGRLKRERGTPAGLGGVAGLAARGWRWWRTRVAERDRRAAKKQLFLVETIVLGPKQKVVLMRCGAERFLVGTGAEGVTSVVRVSELASDGALPLIAGGGAPWNG